MKLKIELNEKETKKFLNLYNNNKHSEGTTMEPVIYELTCDGCNAEYELTYIEKEDSEQPIYCPFCGCDIDLEDVESDDEDDETWLDDLDDIDENEWKD